jgi:heme/copper-type cytochrome/quinol oxidase subunit 2
MAEVNWEKIARRTAIGVLVVGGIALAAPWPFTILRTKAQEQGPARRDVTVTLRKFAFDPPRIEVHQDDLVKVVLHSTDIAHSFTVDAYRIAKRVPGGQTVTFEFRADQAGTFPIYCNLRQDDGCREMKGTLVVRAR